MPADRSPWRPIFDRAERAVGKPLERATHSDRFADLVAIAVGLAAAVRSAYEKSTANALHRANLPAWSDLVWISRRLALVERRIADLADQLERYEAFDDAEQRTSPRQSTDGRAQKPGRQRAGARRPSPSRRQSLDPELHKH